MELKKLLDVYIKLFKSTIDLTKQNDFEQKIKKVYDKLEIKTFKKIKKTIHLILI